MDLKRIELYSDTTILEKILKKPSPVIDWHCVTTIKVHGTGHIYPNCGRYDTLRLPFNSGTVNKCGRYVNELAKRFSIGIIRVPGYRDIPGNCRTDEVNRLVITIILSKEFATVDISLWIHRQIIDSATTDSVNGKWAAWNTDRTAGKIWPSLNVRYTGSLIKFQRS